MRVGLVLAAAFVLLAATVAQAQPDVTPVKLSLSYDGRLYLKVLDIHFDQDIDSTGFDSSVRMRSYGVLALFKRFDVEATSQGRIQDGQAQPLTFAYVNRDGERVRRVNVAWGGDDVTMTSAPAFGNLGQPPASREQKLAAADPLTQLVRIALTHNPSGGCGATDRFFDGKQLYDLAFGPPEPASLSDYEQAMGLVNAVRCPVRYEEVAGFKAKSPAKRNQGLNSPIMVVMGKLGGGGPWVLASLSADTKLGKAKIVLSHVQVTH